jgi:hypothetical protein
MHVVNKPLEGLMLNPGHPLAVQRFCRIVVCRHTERSQSPQAQESPATKGL